MYPNGFRQQLEATGHKKTGSLLEAGCSVPFDGTWNRCLAGGLPAFGSKNACVLQVRYISFRIVDVCIPFP
jgi:hypothetical protein